MPQLVLISLICNINTPEKNSCFIRYKLIELLRLSQNTKNYLNCVARNDILEVFFLIKTLCYSLMNIKPMASFLHMMWILRSRI